MSGAGRERQDWLSARRKPAGSKPSSWLATPLRYAAVTAFQPDLPHVVAHLAIGGTDGRVQLVSNVIGCPWKDVKVGIAVRVVFHDVTPEVTLAKFAPT